jgi:peroxiredoxin
MNNLNLPALVLFIGGSVMLASHGNAQEFNKTLKLGQEAPAFQDLPGTDDKKHSLADFAAKRPLLIFFTCNSCACSQDYEERIVAYAQTFADKIDIVAINVNKIPEDSLPKMKEKAATRKFPFVYLYDETQASAKAYGAVFTPEFFLCDAARKIVYMGAFDDRNNAADAKVPHLAVATQALLDGKAIELKETQARGCLIRFERKRRD